MNNVKELIKNLKSDDRRALARCISLIENDSVEAIEILKSIEINPEVSVTGVTGPPGAGKSTLVGALIKQALIVHPNSKIAVLAVDPTSPFTHGSLLGDRLRMSDYFNHPNVYIRSIATRGALGGLSGKTIEITDLLKSAGFDYIFIETVGVGQSEVEIAALADTTLVVFVPESGDEIQTIKSGIMEIADIFVVNKSDREGADLMVKNLTVTLHERPGSSMEIPVIKTVASNNEGIDQLFEQIESHFNSDSSHKNKDNILISKSIKIVQGFLLRKFDLSAFSNELLKASKANDFNLYRFISEYLQKK